MNDGPPQTPQPQRPLDASDQPIYVPPSSQPSLRPSNHPVYPVQPQQSQDQLASQRLVPPHTSYNPLRADFWRNMSTIKLALVTVVSTLLVIAVCAVPTLLAAHAINTTLLVSPRTKGFDLVRFNQPYDEILEEQHEYLPMACWQTDLPRWGEKPPRRQKWQGPFVPRTEASGRCRPA